MLEQSILLNVKKILGLDPTYTVFDPDIITHINTVFGDLNQLGIGPEDGYYIKDETDLWDDFLQNDLRLNSVRSYMYLRVRLLFDPPTTSYLISSLKEQLKELEWRLNVVREFQKYPIPPDPLPPEESMGAYR